MAVIGGARQQRSRRFRKSNVDDGPEKDSSGVSTLRELVFVARRWRVIVGRLGEEMGRHPSVLVGKDSIRHAGVGSVVSRRERLLGSNMYGWVSAAAVRQLE